MTARRHLDGSTEQPARTVTMPHSARGKVEPTLPEKRIAQLQAIASSAGSTFSETRANFLHRAGVPDSVVDDVASRPPAPPAAVAQAVVFANAVVAAHTAKP